MQILENTIMLVEVTLNCTVCATKPYNEKNEKKKRQQQQPKYKQTNTNMYLSLD